MIKKVNIQSAIYSLIILILTTISFIMLCLEGFNFPFYYISSSSSFYVDIVTILLSYFIFVFSLINVKKEDFYFNNSIAIFYIIIISYTLIDTLTYLFPNLLFLGYKNIDNQVILASREIFCNFKWWHIIVPIIVPVLASVVFFTSFRYGRIHMYDSLICLIMPLTYYIFFIIISLNLGFYASPIFYFKSPFTIVSITYIFAGLILSFLSCFFLIYFHNLHLVKFNEENFYLLEEAKIDVLAIDTNNNEENEEINDNNEDTILNKEELNITTEKTKQSYHISKNRNNKWQVKLTHGKRALKFFDTQAEAIDYAKKLGKKNKRSVHVHSLKGKLRKD